MLNEGLGSWPQRRVLKSPTGVAPIFRDKKLSYPELADRSYAFASVLREWGIAKGSRVAYLGENHPSFLETFFGTTALGALFVAINTRIMPPEINYILNDSGAEVLVVSAALRDTAEAAIEGTKVQHLLVVPDELITGSEKVSQVGQVHTANFEDIIREGDPVYVDVEVTLEDPAYIMYTSGTTGNPKGALLLHRNLTWNSYNVLVDYDVVSSDIAVMISPMFHSAAFGMGTLPILLKGGTLLLEPGFDPGRVLELIQKYKATSISGVPTIYQMLTEHAAWVGTDISSLRNLTCGGSPVPIRVLEAYEDRGLSFTGGYGMTEASPGVTSLQPSRSRDKMGSAGLPHFFTSVRIVDEHGKELPAGEAGEIQVKGPNVIEQYWNLPEASAAAFETGGWFKSGDVGYLDSDGFLFISDRLKDMIISGGENIYPAEIEKLLMELPEVGTAAIFGVPDEKWGEVPWGAIVLMPGAQISEDALREHLTGKLAKYKIPKKYFFVDELPRTASGKVKKNDLRKQYGSN